MKHPRERRRHPRTSPAEKTIEISLCPEGGPIGGTPPLTMRVSVENISEGGVCLVSEEPFELGQSIEFNSPGLPPKGEVIWTSRSHDECKAGIKFLL